MASALILFYDLSEGSKLHSGFDLDRSIFFVERYQLNIIFVLLIFFNISVTVQIEDSDIAIFQLVLLMNPYDLFIYIDRFHTVTGNTDAEVCGCRDIITDFKFFILIRVKKEAGTGRSRFCKDFKRSVCDVDRFFPDIMISLTPDIAENLFALLQGQTVQASLNMDVIYPRITDGTDTIFSFLLLAGYLKPVSDAVETEFGTFMELALPNKEIRRVYNTEILSWLRGTVDGNVMAGLEKALYLNDGKKLQEFLRKYMITCISCFDGAAEGRTRSGGPWLCADRSGTETFYHGMMLGLAAGMSSRYYIRSNRESGEGRFDLVLEPKVHFLPGIIMEFKATKNDAGLSASADEALKQIEDKHYDTDMKDRGIREIVKYGIAFAGKNVEIAIG